MHVPAIDEPSLVDVDGSPVEKYAAVDVIGEEGWFSLHDVHLEPKTGPPFAWCFGGPGYSPGSARNRRDGDRSAKQSPGVWRAFELTRIRVSKGPRQVAIEGFETVDSRWEAKPAADPTVETSPAARKGNQALVDLLDSGRLAPDTVLRHDDKSCVVQGDARIAFGDRVFSSLSAAAVAASGRKSANGWDYWLTSDGSPVGELRGS